MAVFYNSTDVNSIFWNDTSVTTGFWNDIEFFGGTSIVSAVLFETRDREKSGGIGGFPNDFYVPEHGAEGCILLISNRKLVNPAISFSSMTVAGYVSQPWAFKPSSIIEISGNRYLLRLSDNSSSNTNDQNIVKMKFTADNLPVPWERTIWRGIEYNGKEYITWNYGGASNASCHSKEIAWNATSTTLDFQYKLSDTNYPSYTNSALELHGLNYNGVDVCSEKYSLETIYRHQNFVLNDDNFIEEATGVFSDNYLGLKVTIKTKQNNTGHYRAGFVGLYENSTVRNKPMSYIMVIQKPRP